MYLRVALLVPCSFRVSDLHDGRQSYVSNIKVNASKCKVLTATRKKSPVTYQYYLGNTYTKHVLEEEDLGVIISNNLSWDSHVVHIILKTNRMLCVSWREPVHLLRMLKSGGHFIDLSLAKSQLSYATDVWSPGSFKLRMILERVQRRATRSILKSAKSPTNNDCWLFDYFHLLMIGKLLEILYSFLIAFLDLLT